MRLSIDLVRRAPQFTNTLLQREIDLRGLRISSLDEHVLVLLHNSFDVVNLSSNALTALEYFPIKTTGSTKDVRMSRVTTLIAHRNELHRVSAASCALALPGLRHFAADHNRFSAVSDLCFLKHWKRLEMLSLEENPVWTENSNNFDEAKLRAFFVFLCPSLKLINYQRVTKADRDGAQKHKKEFKELMASWESSPFGTTAAAASSSLSGDGKKLRKRGREGRAAAAAAAAVHSSPATAEEEEPAVGYAAAAVDVAAGEDDSDDALQAHLDQLEERLLSDDVNAEEIAQLEEEMTEISTRMAAARKRKRR